jgi:signal transduction histidine kinase
MSKEVLEHLADPFYTTRREQGGTGLGLSISSTIVKEHAGTLEFDSKKGGGTTARIVLPVAADLDLQAGE